MDRLELAGWIILGLNLLVTYATLRDQSLFEKLQFRIADIQAGQWYRLISSAFLHVDWSHFFFNMFSLFIFGGALERAMGTTLFIILYLLSLIGGNLLAWFYHRQEPFYRAVGASGAISGLIFAAIALFPGMELALLFLPFFFPAWVYGLFFLAYSMYGIGKQSDNIGHEAHLGGAIIGLFLTLILFPSLINEHPLTLVYLAVPSIVFLIVLFVKPQLLNQVLARPSDNYDVEDRYREDRFEKEQELNRILEKVKNEGSDALSTSEKEFLENNY